MKSLNTMSARDMLISLASKLPKNLLLDAVDQHGTFAANFLLQLTEEQLCDLRKEARKKNDEPFFLFFYSISGADFAQNKAPKQLVDFDNFNLNRVSKVLFSGSTAPHLRNNHTAPVHYVSVTLVD